ncbi:Pimeloyl-ACP methyl ester carboxylesterase [Salinihabitans flavidus]|uniref:Pimeloyl-ACP methyl ester carboxylesterase n=2 Tax=Salinihabitans flavidus TaxID=569882 RepID=A0A1H8UK12_9RHOB|nr:Pimeloyl-ACP methyl ester carboxylesterase [Salinihabitans flavidus]
MTMKLKGLVALGVALTVQASFAEEVELSEDLTIHYETAGTGDTTILFVPGWAMSTEVFEKQLETFEGSTDYTFVTFDPRGQGESSKTAGGHFYQQHGRDLNAFIEALELDTIVLGGWSFGGNAVLSYVDQFGTERLKGFVMIDAAPKSTGADNTTEWVWYSHDDADGFEAFFTMGPLLYRDDMIAGFADWMLADTSAENIAWASAIAEKTNSTTMALLNAAGTFDDYTEDLTAMDGEIPLLYIVREEWGPVVSEWAAANTPNAMVSATMPSHLGFWEDPEGFNAELMTFLEGID